MAQTRIINKNIKTLVNSYVYEPELLPADLQNVPIGEWVVSDVTDMSNLFSGIFDFNEDINGWDVSGVRNMENMFEDATAFNQDLDRWDVSEVTNMKNMFLGADKFDKDLSQAWTLNPQCDTENMFSANYPHPYPQHGFGEVILKGGRRKRRRTRKRHTRRKNRTRRTRRV